MLNALGHPPETDVMVYGQVQDLEASLALVGPAGGSMMVGPV